ncbi:shikimate kinase [Halalkalibacter akibai]|uniref:Shikimate kinase n=1 Tax=Halalkalibacter akibai (strain ATCC 43226 / DSM 21942 / CIP 109018 / JCM 9157 / 1139) TaxID=1236973 RepID=W4QT10_HALA3|nr:shikimate kinase [Halalkalibacter akibai]GAE35285.1 shikimate kinase I [Halalkalibacter akibai JCM 9157]
MQKEFVPSKDKSIVFIGFMGVGKSTIGKLVADQLLRSFIDLDCEIEKEFGMEVSEIFSKYGEKKFREKEKELIYKYCTDNSNVISLGGGAFLQDEIKDLCLKNCMVIALDMSFDNWLKRFHLIVDSRPVLQGKSMTDIEELFYKRQEMYSTHHLKVSVDNLEAKEVAQYISSLLVTAWEKNAL